MKKVSQESETMASSAEETNEPRARPRLLFTLASTLIAIAHKAYQRVEQLDGAVGSLARGADVVAGPFVRRMEQQWLSSLSFMDRVILIAEKALTAVFPQLRHVSFIADDLAFFAVSLPDKFDHVVDDGLPKLIDQLQVAQLGTMLKNLGNSVMGASSGRVINMAEMDDRQRYRSSSREEEERAVQEQEYESLSKEREDDIKQVEKSCQEIMEALDEMGVGGKKGAELGGHGEKGVDSGEVGEGGGEIKEIEIKGSGGRGGGKAKKGGGGGGGGRGSNGGSNVMMRDPIIELFDEGWQLKPLKG